LQGVFQGNGGRVFLSEDTLQTFVNILIFLEDVKKGNRGGTLCEEKTGRASHDAPVGPVRQHQSGVDSSGVELNEKKQLLMDTLLTVTEPPGDSGSPPVLYATG